MGYIGLGLAHTVGAINSIARSEVFLKLLLALKIRLYGPRMRESYVRVAGGHGGWDIWGRETLHTPDRSDPRANESIYDIIYIC